MKRSVKRRGSLGLSVAVVAATLSCIGAPAFAANLKADWSDVQNPNGPWTIWKGTYFEPVTPLTSVPDWTPLSDTDPAYGGPTGSPGHIAQPAWAPGTQNGNFLPAWFKAAVDPTIAGSDWKAGDIIVHTTDPFNGADGTTSVLFTSPSTGIVNINGAVWDARSIGRANTWELLVDGAILAAGLLQGQEYSIDGSNRDFPNNFSLQNIPVNTGSGVELRLTRFGGAGDFVGVDLDITYDTSVVPVPPALPLLGSALAALGFLARRRRAA